MCYSHVCETEQDDTVCVQGMEAEDRRNAYAADITYVTNSELGFDYLRDNLAQEGGELVLQRKFNYCIIDEVWPSALQRTGDTLC